MHTILRLILLALGGLFVLIGLNFLFDPVTSAANFGLDPEGTLGLASIRADLTAFFVVAGGSMAWGAWKRNGDFLAVTAALMALAFIGRVVTLVVDGPHEGFWVPMLVEAISVALAIAGFRLLPHHSLNEEP